MDICYADSLLKNVQKKRTLVQSVYNAKQNECIDIFLRDSGHYAFREFRRDFEDFGNWFPVTSLIETTCSDIYQLGSLSA